MKNTELKEEIKKRLKTDVAFRESLGFYLTCAEGTVYDWVRTDYKKKLNVPAVIEFCERYIANHPTPIEQEA